MPLYYGRYFKSIDNVFEGSEVGGGDQRISTSQNRGDRPFVHHLYWGDRLKDGGKFAQVIRPPAPIVNDISLTSIMVAIYGYLGPSRRGGLFKVCTGFVFLLRFQIQISVILLGKQFPSLEPCQHICQLK